MSESTGPGQHDPEPQEPDHAGTPIDESGRNPTQRRIDDEHGPDPVPVDTEWVEDEPDDAA